MTDHPNPIVATLNLLQFEIHKAAVAKGWWDVPMTDAHCIGLIHGELSEALESCRKGCPPDDHIPEFSGPEAEFADTIIRLLDVAEARGWRIGEALVAKMLYNETRPYRHGKKF